MTFEPEELGMRLPTHRPPVHPGEMLREEFLAPAGLDADGLAERIGVAPETARELIEERRGLDTDLAFRLHRLTGQTLSFWLHVQAKWDAWHVLREHRAQYERIEPLCFEV